MKRYAKIREGVVENVAVAESSDALDGEWFECGGAGPGWAYSDGVFTRPDSTTPSTMPTLKRWQFHAIIDELGLDTAVRTAIRSLPTKREQSVALAKLDHADEFSRHGPLVVALATVVGMDDDTMDGHWLTAASLK